MSVLGFKRSVGVGDAVYLGLGFFPLFTVISPHKRRGLAYRQVSDVVCLISEDFYVRTVSRSL
jgi:hypothetical protein